jgi:high-affinity nickel-transport protein
MAAMFGFIAFLHIAGALLMWKATTGNYILSDGSLFGWGTAALAYTLGMRHAFDADHISAIDNTTRKLMSEGQRPLAVGFFFSLGHSSVVFALAMLLNFGIRALGSQLQDENSSLHHYTGLIGLTVSGTFLMLIAILNLIILVSIVRVFIQMRKGAYNEEELEKHLDSRGFFMRFFGPIARRIDASWKMYPLGILFGLGFDTATEVGLLVLAGSSVIAGLPWWAIISLPLFFAGGMSLLDTIDGSFMNFAYGWAFSKPVRKVYYNIIITGLSVAVALFVGGLELCQVFAQQLNLTVAFGTTPWPLI